MWGNAATGTRGNEDSMHVTNTTPQMQAFNRRSGCARGLALATPRKSDDNLGYLPGRIRDHDPEMYGVLIRSVRQIIAFVTTRQRKMCATAMR